jgi:hypothetical protein
VPPPCSPLNILTGTVIGQCTPHHRHQEWLKFLKTIDREVPKGLAIQPDSRQLRHPQTPRRQQVAGQSSSVSPALHPDILILVESGRTLVPRADRQSVAARGISFRSRPGCLDPGIHRLTQPQPRSAGDFGKDGLCGSCPYVGSHRPRKSQINPGHITSMRMRPRPRKWWRR